MNEFNKSNKKLIKSVLSAVFAAVLAVVSQIIIPMPIGVPLTLQVFAVAFCGYFLGKWWAVVSVAVYLSVGALGLPVFSGFGSGLGSLFGVTGGFLFGFLAVAFFCGLASKFKSVVLQSILGFIGLLLCNVLGAFQFSMASNVSFITAVVSACLPYLVKDAILIVFADLLAIRVRRILGNRNVTV